MTTTVTKVSAYGNFELLMILSNRITFTKNQLGIGSFFKILRFALLLTYGANFRKNKNTPDWVTEMEGVVFGK